MNRIIDVHTHMFNGHYVPLRNIFYYKFGLGFISGALAILTNALIDDRPIRDKKIKEYDDNKRISLADYNYSDDVQLNEFVEYFHDSLIDILAEKIPTNDINKVSTNKNFSDLIDAYLDIIENDSKEENFDFSRNDSKEKLINYLIIKNNPDTEAKLSKGLGSLFKKWRLALKRKLIEMKGNVSFVGKMLLHEDQLANHLLNSNYDSEYKIALTIHLMMDMDPSFKALEKEDTGRVKEKYNPKLDFYTEQIPRTLKVSQKSNGHLLGFVAFDPHRGQEALDIVKYGLNKGNIGVKLYPPMGYKPDDFGRFPILYKLYTYCETNQVPIMVHCTPVGFDAKKNAGFGLNSDPKYWDEVLKKYSNLILCFGHAGGGDYDVKAVHFNGWYETNEDDKTGWNSPLNYPRKIIKLCQKYPNVYTDMSYLHAMLGYQDKKKQFIIRLKDAVGSDNFDYNFGDKIMYGSDWHMSQIVNRTNDYLNMFKEIFKDEELLDNEKKLSDYADRFFFTNAVKYLRLNEYIIKHHIVNKPSEQTKTGRYLEQIIEQANFGYASN